MVETATAAVKAALRRRFLAGRRAVAPDIRANEAAALQEHLGELAVAGSTVCAYVPIGTEPGSTAMLDGLLRRGVRVLLPVARTARAPAGEQTPLPLGWGEYRPGGLATARFGLLEPAQPWLPADALADAAVVIVPALAVDRRGIRLGRGAGFYDRSLPLRGPNAQLIAMVRDAELVDELPAEPHDVPMTHAVTPRRGVILLGSRSPE